jgi:hypothetical protein
MIKRVKVIVAKTIRRGDMKRSRFKPMNRITEAEMTPTIMTIEFKGKTPFRIYPELISQRSE